MIFYVLKKFYYFDKDNNKIDIVCAYINKNIVSVDGMSLIAQDQHPGCNKPCCVPSPTTQSHFDKVIK